MAILGKIFTWWNGATIGTALYSWRKGSSVGEDAAGNRYFESKDGRRWVIYSGANDASAVSPDWHGWLHHTHDGSPDSYLPPARSFENTAPVPNLTGSDGAYRPSGALEKGGRRAAATGDYEAWSPDNA